MHRWESNIFSNLDRRVLASSLFYYLILYFMKHKDTHIKPLFNCMNSILINKHKTYRLSGTINHVQQYHDHRNLTYHIQ